MTGQEQIFEEIKQIPAEKMAQLYDLTHNFRTSLTPEEQAASPLSFSERWHGQFKPNGATDDAWLDYLMCRTHIGWPRGAE